jgi:hypothetical protein
MQRIDYAPWGVSAICFVSSLLQPAYAKAIWIVGVISLLPLLWSELRKPVNYKSLQFDSAGFVFQGNASSPVVGKWSEVQDVFYCRTYSDFASQIETEWEFRMHNGTLVRVLVEWPHASKFAAAIGANLGRVSAAAVRDATSQRGEGRWAVTFEAPHA